ncbi:MAG TPA: hypothetical protein VHL52_09725 [Acidimicrobiia bacterium]|nr:hypothetical protein [Acidimicrobiia bacterium]
MSDLAAVVSHMGGLDEIAIFALPAAAIILILRRVERRAEERETGRRGSAEVKGPHADH